MSSAARSRWRSTPSTRAEGPSEPQWHHAPRRSSPVGGAPSVQEGPPCRPGFRPARGPAGAPVVTSLTDSAFGQRGGRIADPLGNIWWMVAQVEDVSDQEMGERLRMPEYAQAMKVAQETFDAELTGRVRTDSRPPEPPAPTGLVEPRQIPQPRPRRTVRRGPPVTAGRQRTAGRDLRPIGHRRPLELREREEALAEHLQPPPDLGQVVRPALGLGEARRPGTGIDVVPGVPGEEGDLRRPEAVA